MSGHCDRFIGELEKEGLNKITESALYDKVLLYICGVNHALLVLQVNKKKSPILGAFLSLPTHTSSFGLQEYFGSEIALHSIHLQKKPRCD
jgi:hypothetical protein